MNLNPEACYRAVASRDARFDGRFFTAVRSTGIYCRPVCPARTPHRKNCIFFGHAAAAEEAGFRPCLRCRPETSPGTPAWAGTGTTVSRALRLIEDGALEEGGVDELAGRLGVGARHLRRLFHEHLGASPVAVAQTRRVQFAKRLVDETSLPLTEVAFAAGFGSVRRFNESMRRTYGRSPRELRRDPDGVAPAASGAPLTLRLRFRPPLDWGSLIAFLSLRATPGVESVTGTSYRRTVRTPGGAGVLEVRPVRGESFLLLSVPGALSRDLVRITDRVRRLFDLGADPQRIAGHLRRDRVLAPLVRRCPGLRVPGAWDGFEVAARAILGQQVTVRGATTLAGRLVQSYGERIPEGGPDELAWTFPSPEQISRVRPSRLGMPSARARALRELAHRVHKGEICLDGSADHEETMTALQGIPGVGDWTAQYIAMRALGDSDAFPSGDLGLRDALAEGGRRATPARVRERAEAWRPWRAYAAMHLWTNLSSNSTKEAKDGDDVRHVHGQPGRKAHATRNRRSAHRDRVRV